MSHRTTALSCATLLPFCSSKLSEASTSLLFFTSRNVDMQTQITTATISVSPAREPIRIPETVNRELVSPEPSGLTAGIDLGIMLEVAIGVRDALAGRVGGTAVTSRMTGDGQVPDRLQPREGREDNGNDKRTEM
jgi:hypothetical protein